jgi:hypothetical protein
MVMEHKALVHVRRCRDRIYLRAAVLRIGGLLGWKAHEVIGFTEALTGRGWRHCGPDQFQTVLDEYLALGRAIQIQQKVPCRAEDARQRDGTGGTDAPAD